MLMVMAVFLTSIVSHYGTEIDALNSETLVYDGSPEICLKPECVNAASDILRSLDENTDPCDDFYQFACGGWEAKHHIAENEASVTVFSEAERDLNQQLRDLVEMEINESEPNFIKLAKKLYGSCMDLDAIEEAGSKPIEYVLNTLGGWPVVEGDTWDESKLDFIDVLIILKEIGIPNNIILGLVVMPDYRNKNISSIYLAQPFLGMPDSSYFLRGLEDPATLAYFELMLESAKKLGADAERAEREMREVFDFETELAESTASKETWKNVDKIYNELTLEELMDLVPQINWPKYFNGLLPYPIDENQIIIVQVPDYIIQVGDLLSTTDKRVIFNYLLWRVLASRYELLSKEWRDLLQEYAAALKGNTQEAPRWTQCLTLVKGNLGIALSSYYVKQDFDADTKEQALELVKYFQREFLTVLDNVDWMDDSTKEIGIDKVKRITPLVGYPPELLNDTLVSHYYKDLNIGSSYFFNALNLQRWSTRSTCSGCTWLNHANVISICGQYILQENSIEITAGTLQYPFFDINLPAYLNFGAIGFIAGHELIHSFDDLGRQFDVNGNNVNLWDDTTEQRFKERERCIVEQYGNFTDENGMKLNAVNTRGEDIADNGGLKVAYETYQTWMKDHGPEPALPGLNYTANQLLFISAATTFCAKYRPEELKLKILTDVHSPAQFRVNGPVSNLPQFSEAFQCKIGTNMNPEQKCNVW